MEGRVLWGCNVCDYEWYGVSPYNREKRPYCPRCGSWSVKVRDWLIDKERWKKARLETLKRDHWQCRVCGQKLSVSAPIHHISYDDYYSLDNLISLCPKCHQMVHERGPFVFQALRGLGILLIALSSLSIVKGSILAFILFLGGGIGSVIISHRLEKRNEVWKVKKKISEIIKNRHKSWERNPVENNEEFPFGFSRFGR